jgi:rod shape-determining protein MreC
LVIVGLLTLAWVVLLGQPTGFGRWLRGLGTRLITPFERVADLIPVVRTQRELSRQNDRLRADNLDLHRQLAALEQQRDDNLQLRALLQFKQAAPWRTVGARVIGRDAGNWWHSIQLDRGSADGLRPNLPVVAAPGLVGKIVSVTAGESRALLLIDRGCRVSAVLETSREPGIVNGAEAALGRQPRLQMTFVTRQAAVRVGERAITSGLGGVFPRGIVLGMVTGAKLNPQTGMYQDVELQPAVDFRRLEEVLVIVE